ncbi:MAG: ATP-binding protein [Parachlamydiales bacterium]|jgi:hypothetical protein
MDLIEKLKNVEDENELIKLLHKSEEGQSIDFNSYFPKNDNTKKDDWFGICKLVGAFVNNLGGTILIGVEETGGIFSGICGVEIENWERIQKHIQDKLRSHYEPLIENVFFKKIKLYSGKFIVIIFCPKSKQLHQLKENGQPSIYPKRVGCDVVAMTASEIANAYKIIHNEGANFSKLISSRNESLDFWLNNVNDFRIESPAFVIHAYPENENISINISEWNLQQKLEYALDSLIQGNANLINSQCQLRSEGLIYYSDINRYLVVSPKGALELVLSDIEYQNGNVIAFAEWVKTSFLLVSKVLTELSLITDCKSWNFAISLIGVKGRKLSRGTGNFPHITTGVLPKDKYLLEFVKIDISGINDISSKMEKRYKSNLEKVWHDVNSPMPN